MRGGGAGGRSDWPLSSGDQDDADEEDHDHGDNTTHDTNCHVDLTAGPLQLHQVLTDVSQEQLLVIKTFVELFVLEILDDDVGVQCAGVRSC